ncbi:hypothetical protein Goarm_004222, partial [Gossypium armourianum]|nr:hypothetical protein [Gossypium armourianum]
MSLNTKMIVITWMNMTKSVIHVKLFQKHFQMKWLLFQQIICIALFMRLVINSLNTLKNMGEENQGSHPIMVIAAECADMSIAGRESLRGMRFTYAVEADEDLQPWVKEKLSTPD